jgi:hypothetical protein
MPSFWIEDTSSDLILHSQLPPVKTGGLNLPLVGHITYRNAG